MLKFFIPAMALIAHTGPHGCGGHDHDEPDEATEEVEVIQEMGPNGGLLFSSVEPAIEFLLRDDKTFQVIAVDSDGQPLPIGDLEVKLLGGDRAEPTEIEFRKEGERLVSNGSLPPGDAVPVVLQIIPVPGGNQKIERFDLDIPE
ncbi:MAG: hypothetical protein AAF236_06820 [Verrucomicrobiota bacterium]